MLELLKKITSNSFPKRNFFFFLVISFLFSIPVHAQNEGISFQGLARNANGEVLVSQKIGLRLSILLDSESGAVAYVETREATTNPQGIFAVVVGDENSLTKSINFSGINWTSAAKYIKVEMDANGGASYVTMGTSRLQAVPFAYYAYGVNAENVQGILPVGSGGTGAANLGALKTSIGLDKVNNTSDSNKPISAATQSVLSIKVDKVSGKDLSTNDYTTAEKTKLATITGTNTGDQNLSAYATTSQLSTKANVSDVASSLATKVDKVSGKDLSTKDYTAAEKTKLAAITGTNTGDQVNIIGNAATATKLQNTVTINGIAFDGSSNVTIPSTGTVPYSGATGAVDLGGYDLKVNGLNVGKGGGSLTNNTTFGNSSLGLNTTGTANSAVGFESLKSNTTGQANTALGSNALRENQNGARNTAVGSQALQLTNGAYDNTAVGSSALRLNTLGRDNTAVGSESLSSNTTGYYNTGIGKEAMKANINGTGNTAIGYQSMVRNTSAGSNTAVGYVSMYSNTTADYNTAVGKESLQSNTTGSVNTVIGAGALDRNINGGYNTVLGGFAGRYIADGGSKALDGASDGASSNIKMDNSILIGAWTKPNAINQTNQIVIGYNAVGNGSNTIQLGDTNITLVKTSGTVNANGATLTSDFRLKSKIIPLENSLATIMQLNPVHYMKKGSLTSTNYTKEENGFIAQEIQKVLPFIVTEDTDKNKLLSVDYNSLIPILTKAIQEQQEELKLQKKSISTMQKELEELKKLVKELEK